MNSQIHLTIETYELDKLRKEAEYAEEATKILLKKAEEFEKWVFR